MKTTAKTIPSCMPCLRLLCAIVLATLATDSTASTSGRVVSRFHLTVSGLTTVGSGENAEAVRFTGNVHMLVDVGADPSLLNRRCHVHSNLYNFIGVGETSGRTYRAVGSAHSRFEVELPTTFELWETFPIFSARAVPPDSGLPIFFSVSLDSAGQVAQVQALIDIDGPALAAIGNRLTALQPQIATVEVRIKEILLEIERLQAEGDALKEAVEEANDQAEDLFRNLQRAADAYAEILKALFSLQ